MKLLPLCILFFTLNIVCAQSETTALNVTIEELRENPEKYHQKTVIVSGYMNLEFEGDSLYPGKSDYENHAYAKSLYLYIEDRYALKKKGINKIYVIVKATFQKDMKGHFGMWFGGLTNIKDIKLKK